MYIEILIVAALIFFAAEYAGMLNVGKFVEDYHDILWKLKEKDYDFLLAAKYGVDVNINEKFNTRIKYAFIALAFSLFFLFANFSYIMIIVAVGIAVLVYKLPYLDLKSYRRRHLNDIDSQLPYYLKNLEILIQHYTVPIALGKSIDTAPAIFRDGLQKLVDSINAGDSSVEPYMQFARDYPVRDSMRMMRLLYRLSLGKQENKQEQLMAFSKTISNLQQKSRENKYKTRLEKMESKTMTMLVATGVGVMILMVVAILMTFSI